MKDIIDKNYEKENNLMYRIIDRYTSNLNAQKNSLSISLSAISMQLTTVSKKFERLKKKANIETQKDSEGKDFLIIPVKYHSEFDVLVDEMEASIYALGQLPKDYVVSLVCIYDAYVGNLIKTIYKIKPELLQSCNIEFKSCDLLSFSNIDEVKDFIVEKEVENVLRDNHMNQIKWLENKLGIKLTKGEPHFVDFEEIMERRNLFVHCDGRVSRQYLKVCSETKLKLNDVATVDANYISHCTEILYEMGVKLGQVLWRKLNIGIEKCDESLQDVTYNLIKDKQYKLAESLLDFATQKETKHFDTNTELVFIVNKALAFYLQDKQQECEKIINSHDWSAYDVVYKLAKEILCSNYDNAANLMKQMKNDEKDKLNYQEWPLYRKFRTTEVFLETYKQIFNEDFEYKDPQKTNWEEVIRETNNFIEDLKQREVVQKSI